MDPAFRGKEDVIVELVRADDTPVGVTARTTSAGYFAVQLDQEQAEALAAERQLFLRVKDAQGNVLHRDTQPLTISATQPTRATAVIANKVVPADVLARGQVIFRKPVGATLPGRATPLESVKGIGPATASRLRAAGIPDVATLLRTPGARLVEIAGFDAEVMRTHAREAQRKAETARAPDKSAEPSETPAEKPAARKRSARKGRKRGE
jgi:hypothetical protein